MLLCVFTLRFNSATERFDDSAIAGFLADKEVLSIKDHFFVKDDVPYLALVVCYRAPAAPPAASTPKAGQKRDESWRDLLSEVDWPLFNALRGWRGDRAKKEGIPPYVICNNRQLAELVKARPTTLAGLGEVEGIGEAKLKKYGKEILALLAGSDSGKKGEGDDQT